MSSKAKVQAASAAHPKPLGIRKKVREKRPHPDRKVVLRGEGEYIIAEVRHWRRVPCDPRRCRGNKSNGWGCLFLCRQTGTEPSTYEKQVFAGNNVACEQFIKGFNEKHMKMHKIDKLQLNKELQDQRQEHTISDGCNSWVLPIYAGRLAAYRYSCLPVQLWNQTPYDRRIVTMPHTWLVCGVFVRT